MGTISLFEAKAQISAVVQKVATTGESMVLTVRGKPMVRIVPYREEAPGPDVWELREAVVAHYGVPDLPDAPRSEVARNPLDGD